VIVTNNGSFPTGPRQEPASPDLVDRLIRQAVEAQIRAGCGLVTDGLVRGRDLVAPLVGALKGVAARRRGATDPSAGSPHSVPIIEAEVAWSRPIFVEDFVFAGGGSTVPVKAVLIGPYTLARLAEDRAYNDPMALAMALATALNRELRTLEGAGAKHLQINEPALLDHRDDFPLFTRIWEVLGRGISATLCLHLEGADIRGLYPGIARLKRLGCLSLDCVAGRGNLTLLAEAPFPDGLRLALGLVDGSRDEVERPETLAATLAAAAGLPPADRLLLGNASDLGGLAPDIASAKLRALADVAGRAAMA